MHFFPCSLLCIYAFIQFLFGYTPDTNVQQNNNQKHLFLKFIFTALTMVTYLLISTFYLPFFILHHSVDIYLRIKLGPAYGGMLKRQDAGLKSLRDKMMIRIVFILNEDKLNPINWKSCLGVAEKIHNSSFKLSSITKNCLGYFYYLKNQTKFDEVVKEIKIGDGNSLTKDAFLDYVSDLRYNKDEEHLWSFSYFPQPIQWKNDKKTTQYAIIISVQHCITDGPNLVKYFMEYLTEEAYNPPQSKILTTLDSVPKLSIDDAYISQNPLYRCKEGYPKLNKMQGYQKGREEYTAFFAEDTQKYLSLIKKVKTKLGIGFSSVLLGAFSSSLEDHLKKNLEPPRDLTLCTIIRPEEINLVFKSNHEDALMNDIGLQTIKIPALQATCTLKERLHAINESLKLVRSSLDSTMAYLLAKYMHVVPSVIQRLVMSSSLKNLTSLISNMSEVNNLEYCGHPLESVLFFVSNLPPAFTFCVMTLNGRLQLTLHASGLYVSSREELQDILHGTLENIDKFAKELQIV